ncbi:hypothetical protein GCM10025864_44470 [Luteimicrobium album]|uniref:Uncharacterized protein n=1 Tax=Luteimicrobium album TaxID=1054550 RepID=A0ABQ6HVV7_9MICO|nr:hypothetical protein [Luteimicrobium album]GMA22282.1 hypothetical protein GCM10025864_00410 [Luteimicrobium album]GMA26688.1 hypothetical protein GCM10025864_44470 [Luteimicrobium album]
MSLVYATPADLAAWTGTAAPANAVTLLRVASGLVRRATVTAWYATNDTGAPTDPDVVQAFSDATCAQAATWATLGIDPTTAGVDTGTGGRVVASRALGPANISYAGADDTAARRAQLADDLTPEALGILADAGLVRGVRTHG